MTDLHRWSRRGALAALLAGAGAPAFARVLPGPAKPDLSGLRALALAATATPPPAATGAAHAAGRSRAAIEAALLARLGSQLGSRLEPVADADWRRALLESGRRDLTARDMIEIEGRPVMRTEVDLLALGVLLRQDEAS